MQVRTAQMRIATVGTAVAVAGAGLVGYAAVASGVDNDKDGVVPVMEAPSYVGDPWEKRYRDQFWSTQHIHDSWNPCHIGENVPKRLQGSGPDCWSRLPGHTDR